MKQVPLKNVRLAEGYLSPYYRLVRDVMIPYQWEAMNDRVEGAVKSHCIDNIRIAAGQREGEFYGFLFQDSDVAKWLEALAYCVQNGDAAEFEAIADGVIQTIKSAQQPDGYFNTYIQLTAPERKLTNLYEAHELYCLGHLAEAAAAYTQATGKRELLDIVLRFIDLIDSRFGSGEGKLRGYPGHQEIELALARLYEVTNDGKLLRLGKYFLDERGREPHFFTQEWEKRGGLSEWTQRSEKLPADYTYNQAHLPVREQDKVVGHAVRAMYMYAAMAEIGRLSGDESLLDACRVLFEDLRRQTYVTGGIGSTNHGEAFTFAYDLPNETNYSETCASIGLVFFMHAMLKTEVDAACADLMENALYNTVLAGVSTDGQSYFYVNPMETVPEANERNPARTHAKSRRQKWNACACCPPNISRLLASIGKYLYSVDGDTVYVHLYAASDVTADLKGGPFAFGVRTGYPLDGAVMLTAGSDVTDNATLAFRVPGWCGDASFKLNGKNADVSVRKGYAYITHKFVKGDVLELSFDMRPRVVYANPGLRAAAGKACIRRGPLVYCLEERDNIPNLHSLSLDASAEIREKPGSVGGMDCVVLTAGGFAEESADDSVYTHIPKKRAARELVFVPYHLWGNGGDLGEMIVWVRER
ncbi:MAG: glycoside hydrolase family 127 protein [Defluviitaleaceae bacterium]|nr:glycoside hydrolase family 127 protein [Defluviitaleaceae bacterium]MCL2836037.1 glycoside hydrolase family 127 protein [Defluviitaleaceae bacterium]